MLALLAVRFVDEFAGFLPTGAFESFRTDLGLSYTEASIVLVAGAPGAIVGNVFAVLADYRSRRVIAAGGALGFAVALALFAWAPSFAMLVVASFVLGVASSAMCDATEVALIDLAGEESPAMVSRAFLIGSVGDVAGPALLIAVAAAGADWRLAFAIGAGVTAAYALWLGLTPLPPPPPRAPDDSPRTALGPIVRDRRIWYLGVLAMLLGPLDEDALAFLIAYLQRGLGLGTAAATSIAFASVTGAIVGFVSTSRRSYRPAARAMRNQAIIVAIASVVSVSVPVLTVIVVAQFVFGVALARYWIALKMRIVATHPDRVGTVKAVVSTIEFSGFVLPVLAGRVADTFGVRAGYALSAVAALVMLALICALDSRAQEM